MVKKDAVYNWGKREKDAFTHFKQAIIEAPMLYIPNFSKGFFLYTFASDTSLSIVLTQKDELNNERPISFMQGCTKRGNGYEFPKRAWV